MTFYIRIVCSLLGVLFIGDFPSAKGQSVPLTAFPTPALSTTVPLIKTTDRAATLRLYNTYYLASSGVPSGFTGNVAQGKEGMVSAAYQDATLRRINCFRVLAGLPGNLTFDRTLNAKAQKAALMMSANNALDHFPPRTWRLYTPEGAEAAGHSCLSLGSAGPDAVTSLMADDGDNNFFVGHRRWLLFPGQAVMGSGSVDDSAGEGHFPDGAGYTRQTCVVWTVGAFRARAYLPGGFVSWPPPGYVPAPLVFNRWSFSYPDADFSTATVTVLKNGAPIAVTQETPKPSAAGDNTVVWTLPGNTVSPAADETYKITVNRVGINRAPRPFTYQVTTCNPDPAP